jgi:hypothetical protein
MPAKAGLQEDSTPAAGFVSWIPGLAVLARKWRARCLLLIFTVVVYERLLFRNGASKMFRPTHVPVVESEFIREDVHLSS